MNDSKDCKDSKEYDLKIKCDCSKDYELEAWKRLWVSRDFEIQHFWQRSLFLSGFLLLSFTAYGGLQGIFLGKFFENKICLDSIEFEIYNLISIFLCVVCCILSVLWIMMTKGAKNAYEAQENALITRTTNETLKKAYVDLNSFSQEFESPCILNTKAYRYSVSKINIFLGIFSLFIFMMLCALHLICYFFCKFYILLIWFDICCFLVLYFIFVVADELDGGQN